METKSVIIGAVGAIVTGVMGNYLKDALDRLFRQWRSENKTRRETAMKELQESADPVRGSFTAVTLAYLRSVNRKVDAVQSLLMSFASWIVAYIIPNQIASIVFILVGLVYWLMASKLLGHSIGAEEFANEVAKPKSEAEANKQNENYH